MSGERCWLGLGQLKEGLFGVCVQGAIGKREAVREEEEGCHRGLVVSCPPHCCSQGGDREGA